MGGRLTNYLKIFSLTVTLALAGAILVVSCKPQTEKTNSSANGSKNGDIGKESDTQTPILRDPSKPYAKGTAVSSDDLFLAPIQVLANQFTALPATIAEVSLPTDKGTEILVDFSQTGVITNIRLDLDISHSYMGDIEISLVNPTGHSVVVRPSGTTHPSTRLRTSYFAVVPDNFTPDQGYTAKGAPELIQLLNRNFKGQWIIRLRDLITGETGSVTDAKLRVYADKWPEANPVTNPPFSVTSVQSNLQKTLPSSDVSFDFQMTKSGTISDAHIAARVNTGAGKIDFSIQHPDGTIAALPAHVFSGSSMNYLLFNNAGGGGTNPVSAILGKPTSGVWKVRARSDNSAVLESLELTVIGNVPNAALMEPQVLPFFSANPGQLVTRDNLKLSIPDSNTTGITQSFQFPQVSIIGDIGLDVTINHPYSTDLRFDLKHPDGTTVTLGPDQKTSGIITLSFGAPTGNGASLLSVLRGKSLGGTWSLTVKDLTGGDTGYLIGFKVQVNQLASSSTALQSLNAFSGPFAQVTDSRNNRTIMTTGRDGRYQMLFFANNELGALNPLNNEIVTCDSFRPFGSELILTGLSGCQVTGYLTDIPDGANYPSGEALRRGDSFYYKSGNFLLRLGGVWRYDSGRIFRSSDGSYFWSDGNYAGGRGERFFFPDGRLLRDAENIYFYDKKSFAADSGESFYRSGSFIQKVPNRILYPRNDTTGSFEGNALRSDDNIYYSNGRPLRQGSKLLDESGQEITSTITKTYTFSALETEINLEATLTNYVIMALQNRQGISGAEAFGFIDRPSFGPPTPKNFTVTATQGQLANVSLSWDPITTEIDGFVVVKTPGAQTIRNCASVPSGSEIVTLSSSQSNHSFNGLPVETPFTFAVCSKTADGYISAASSKSITTPGAPAPVAPSSLTLDSRTTTSLTLKWPAGTGVISSYLLSYRTGGTPPPAGDLCKSGDQIAGTQLGTNLSYTVTGLTPNTSYSFRICAQNSNATPVIAAGASATFETLPPAAPNPKDLTATAISGTKISIQWSSGGTPTSGYILAFRSGSAPSDQCTNGSIITSAQIGSNTTYTVTGLSPATIFYFRVCSVSSLAGAAVSTGVTVSTNSGAAAPPAPTNFQVLPETSTALKASWTSGGGSTAKFILITKEGATPSNCSDGLVNELTSTTSSLVITNLKVNTSYGVRICSQNANVEPDMTQGPTITAKTKSLPPPDISGLIAEFDTATPPSVKPINLRWTSGGGTTEDYRVVFTVDGSTPASCNGPSQRVANTTFTVSSPTPGTLYTFRVCAAASDPTADFSSGKTVSIKTDSAPPPAPTNLSATAQSMSSINVTWKSGGGSTSRFSLIYKEASAPSDCKDGSIIDIPGSDTSVLVQNLTVATIYGVRLCAHNSNANPDTTVGPSLTIRTKQSPPPDVQSLSALMNGISTGISLPPINLTWFSGGGSTKDFAVAFSTNGTPPSNCSVSSQLTTLPSYTLIDPLPMTEYIFRVCSRNDNTPADYSTGQLVTIKTADIPLTPLILKSYELTHFSNLRFGLIVRLIRNFKGSYSAAFKIGSEPVNCTDGALSSGAISNDSSLMLEFLNPQEGATHYVKICLKALDGQTAELPSWKSTPKAIAPLVESFDDSNLASRRFDIPPGQFSIDSGRILKTGSDDSLDKSIIRANLTKVTSLRNAFRYGGVFQLTGSGDSVGFVIGKQTSSESVVHARLSINGDDLVISLTQKTPGEADKELVTPIIAGKISKLGLEQIFALEFSRNSNIPSASAGSNFYTLYLNGKRVIDALMTSSVSEPISLDWSTVGVQLSKGVALKDISIDDLSSESMSKVTRLNVESITAQGSSYDANLAWYDLRGSNPILTTGRIAVNLDGTQPPTDCLGGNTGGNLQYTFRALPANRYISLRICELIDGQWRSGISTVFLTSKSRPAAVKDLKVTKVEDVKFSIAWSAGDTSTVGYRAGLVDGTKAPSECTYTNSVDTQNNPIGVFDNLISEKTYTAYACARSADGMLSPISSVMVTTTRKPAPQGMTISVGSVSSSSVTLNWQYPTSVTKFYVGVTVDSSPDIYCSSWSSTVSQLFESKDNLKTLTIKTRQNLSSSGFQLQPKESYYAVICDVSTGKESFPNRAAFSIPGAPPPNPTSLKATANKNKSIGLSWKSGGKPTSGYIVMYAEGLVAPSTCTQSGAKTTKTSWSTPALKANTAYAFRVCATSPDGVSAGVTIGRTTVK